MVANSEPMMPSAAMALRPRPIAPLVARSASGVPRCGVPIVITSLRAPDEVVKYVEVTKTEEAAPVAAWLDRP